MALGLGEMLGLALADAEGLGLTKALGLGEGSSDGWALGLAEGDADGDSVGLALGEADGIADGDADGEALGDAEGSSDGLGLADSEAEGAGEAVGVSADDEAVCGCEASLKIKSLTLLSVSSPLPLSASAVNMLSAVDPELAFLSTLLFASGAVKVVPSVKPLAAVPKATASTIVPVSSAPSLKAIPLLFATVWAVLLLHPRAISKLLLHQRKNPCAGITSSALNATIEVSADPVAVLLTNLKSPSATSASVGL